MAHLSWTKGGEANVLLIEADAVTLSSTIPSPPGSRIEGKIKGDDAAAVKFKIHGSKKQPDGSFVLIGRPIDMTKEIRERLAAMIAR